MAGSPWDIGRALQRRCRPKLTLAAWAALAGALLAAIVACAAALSEQAPSINGTLFDGNNAAVDVVTTGTRTAGALLAAAALWSMGSAVRRRREAAATLPGDRATSAGAFALGLKALTEMVKDPEAFWERQRELAFSTPAGLSWNVLTGALCLFASNAEVITEVLKRSNGKDFKMVLHPNANIILGKQNIAFMHGAAHKALRASFLPLFTKRALGMYLPLQQRVIERHLSRWVELSSERASAAGAKSGRGGAADGGDELYIEARELCRDMNLETSQRVFLGPRLAEADVEGFNVAYFRMVEAFLSLPLFFPGTALWRGWRGRHHVLAVLRKCARAAFEAHGRGEQPECLLDLWVARVVADMDEARAEGRAAPGYANVDAVADSCMDFLFASQDASTASLTWAVAHVADKPDMAERVRAEATTLLADGKELTYEGVASLAYTWCVVKEILRFRPPATMVPQVSSEDVKLKTASAGGFVIRKGTLVMPSIYAASKQGFTNPEIFDPDRMGPERREDLEFKSNFVPFGVGPHMCVGYQYAMQQLVVFVAMLCVKTDISRRRTPRSDDVLYYPTIYPWDCLTTFSSREP